MNVKELQSAHSQSMISTPPINDVLFRTEGLRQNRKINALFCPCHALGLATFDESNETLTHMIEKPRREEAVSDCARIGIGDRPQIRTRPEEFVGLA